MFHPIFQNYHMLIISKRLGGVQVLFFFSFRVGDSNVGNIDADEDEY